MSHLNYWRAALWVIKSLDGAINRWLFAVCVDLRQTYTHSCLVALLFSSTCNRNVFEFIILVKRLCCCSEDNFALFYDALFTQPCVVLISADRKWWITSRFVENHKTVAHWTDMSIYCMIQDMFFFFPSVLSHFTQFTSCFLTVRSISYSQIETYI